MSFSTAPFSIPPIAETQKLNLLRLARSENIGPISFFHLLKRYGSAEEALNRLPDIAKRVKIPSLSDIKREYEAHDTKGYQLLSYYDSAYPPALRTLKDPPPFISVQGRLEVLKQTTFAIVGSRSASQAGERIADEVSRILSLQKWTIASGLARGIDACAHRSALQYGTIGVIAGGLGHIYPPENKKLYQELAEQGLIISEDPLFQQPHAALFPKRNRIISGLSWGVLIVEATLKSGSLMTAKYAIEQNRTLFAIPGHPLDPRSRGVNRLLKQGACLVESADDIFEEYKLSSSRLHLAEADDDDYSAFSSDLSLIKTIPNYDIDPIYPKIAEALTFAPTPIPELAQHLDISVILLRSLLVEMELNAEIERYPGDCVMLSSTISEKEPTCAIP